MWGIAFEKPYVISEQGNRKVRYVSQSELSERVSMKYKKFSKETEVEVIKFIRLKKHCSIIIKGNCKRFHNIKKGTARKRKSAPFPDMPQYRGSMFLCDNKELYKAVV